MLNRVTVTGWNDEVLDCSFLSIGVPNETYREPKDFNGPTGIYWIQGTGGFFAKWDGNKFKHTEETNNLTNKHYKEAYGWEPSA